MIPVLVTFSKELSPTQYKRPCFCGYVMKAQLVFIQVPLGACSGNCVLDKHWSLLPGLTHFPPVEDSQLQLKGLETVNEGPSEYAAFYTNKQS